MMILCGAKTVKYMYFRGFYNMWITDSRAEPKTDGLFRFKRNFTADNGSRLIVRVSADTRYKLFLNGKQVLSGPCKGNRFVTYYETADLSEHLTDGENELTALVMHFNERMAFIYRTEKTAFMLDGGLIRSDGSTEDLSTDEKWLSSPDNSLECTAPPYWCFTDFTERIDFLKNNLNFQPAQRVCDAYFTADYPFGEATPWKLKERTIPPLTKTEHQFVRVMRSSLDAEALLGGDSVTFAPNTTHYVEIDAGAHFTGTPHIELYGGKGAKISLTYAESYVFKDGWRIKKKQRNDTDGIIYGMTDELICDGENHTYEPFWFRTFRFVRIEVTTANEPVTVSGLRFYENKYPLDVSACFSSSDRDAAALWETSIRTVNNCMHETFEDCPYYEQTQYAMDSRLEALFTYQLSSDRRLAKKCVTEFIQSQYPDGITQSRYPCLSEQVIAGFSLHLVYMIDDYLKYTPDDRAFVRTLLPKIDSILSWFDRRINKNGVVGDTEYWRFLDWVKEWKDGCPSEKGAMSAYSFMYALALKKAAEMNRFFGYNDMAAEYDRRADSVNESAVKCFYDAEKGLFKDTEQGGYSQHSQIWAVLSGAVGGGDASALMERMLSDQSLSVCSYSMMFYVFRALEKAGLYDRAYKLLDRWRAMLAKGVTTWVEDDVKERSDCHGWGSLPIYEFTAVILGVRPHGYAGNAVDIMPHIAGLTHAEGTVSTPNGDIDVKWSVSEGKFTMSVSGSGEKHITMPDGSIHITNEQNFKLLCAI